MHSSEFDEPSSVTYPAEFSSTLYQATNLSDVTSWQIETSDATTTTCEKRVSSDPSVWSEAIDNKESIIFSTNKAKFHKDLTPLGVKRVRPRRIRSE